MDGGAFDDHLSLRLADLRASTDRQLHGTAELLDLEVDLSRSVANTLHDYSDALELLDGIDDLFDESGTVLAAVYSCLAASVRILVSLERTP